MRIYFASILIIFPLLLGSWEITGTVKDIDGKPVSGAMIRLEIVEIRCMSDEAGRFSITLPSSIEKGSLIALQIEAQQFFPDRRNVRINKSRILIHIVLIPIKVLKEDITVTALNEQEKSVSVPFAQTVASQTEIRENIPESPVAALVNSPGVQFIGKGGISITPSIRGLARRRILLMVDGSRIISDRSAGASASFVPPDFIQRIEVVRSAASVLYGSDAIGGVINIFTRGQSPQPGFSGMLNLNGSTSGSRLNGSVQVQNDWDSFNLALGLHYVNSGDYHTPNETVLHSGYTYSTGELAMVYRSGKRDFSLEFLKSEGKDVGKPERANDPGVYSFYPSERNNLLKINYQEKKLKQLGDFSFDFFVNPNSYDLKKIKESNKQIDYSANSATDTGARLFLRKQVNSSFSYQWGVDYFGRFNVDMKNETSKKGVVTTSSFPVENGRRNDFGVYTTFDYSGLKMIDLVGGARFSFFSRRAISDDKWMEKKSKAPAFFLGVTGKLYEHLALFFNIGTAFRVPSLSEAFYTGITGRTSIVGNPALEPEHSLNLDTGIKFFGGNLYAGVYLFQYSIQDMIEKFTLDASAYTYNNIEKGIIRGMEFEFQLRPFENFEFFGNGFYYYGKSSVSGQPLNDVPAPHIFLAGRLWLGRVWTEASWLWSGRMDRPGPTEVANSSYNTFNLKAGLYLSNRLNIFLRAANLFNSVYYPNADPDIPPAKGFDFSAGISCLF